MSADVSVLEVSACALDRLLLDPGAQMPTCGRDTRMTIGHQPAPPRALTDGAMGVDAGRAGESAGNLRVLFTGERPPDATSPATAYPRLSSLCDTLYYTKCHKACVKCKMCH